MPLYNLPEHCDPTSSLLSSLSSSFHTCVPTPLALLSTTLGILSIVSWLCAQFPQIIKNYQLKSASGLSIYFLAEWLLGDLTNLLGALLTRQAVWQVVVAAYYVTVDVCLVAQYFWYSYYKAWREKSLHVEEDGYHGHEGDRQREVLVGTSRPQHPSAPKNMKGAIGQRNEDDTKSMMQPKSSSNSLFRNLNFSWSGKEKNTPSSSYRSIRRPAHSPTTGVSPNTFLVMCLIFAVVSRASPLDILSPNQFSTAEQGPNSLELAGQVLSWISTLCYLGSRLPQIYKNHKRRSTSGLSPSLFIAAFFGNLFYSTSLLTSPLAWTDAPPFGLHGWAGADGNDRIEWITRAAPFFLGAAGVLFMDAIIGIQFLRFGEGEAAAKTVVVVDDERGRSHWRSVRGWMRGWIPSPIRPKKTRGEDGERPLLERGRSDDVDERRYGGA
ncbi:MAG: hypothetical protein LQ352_004511 [Teloschistes flavicans]|nr:MAG: hypothetical protein LQ352_004511 [Teloschistes flavicans]